MNTSDVRSRQDKSSDEETAGTGGGDEDDGTRTRGESNTDDRKRTEGWSERNPDDY